MVKILAKLFILFFIFTLSANKTSWSQSTSKQEKKELRKAKRQDKIDKGKLMITPLAGPAYTPEMKFTIAGGVMVSFKTNPKDSLIQRSSAPVTLGVSSTGAMFIGTKYTTFWLEDKLRIYGDLIFKTMPDNYFGVGFDSGFHTPKSDSTTAFDRTWWVFNPKILWQFKEYFFIGPLIDLNYTKGKNPSLGVENDPYYQRYNDKPFNSGTGLVFQYDSRDVPVNAWKGAFIELSAGFYGGFLGGQNNYQIYSCDLRKYWKVKKDGRTVAVQVRGRFGNGNVPYGEMSQPGTPFDLRGYSWGNYRAESMVFALTEYRHMFYKKNGQISPHGIVAWVGAGTLGENISSLKGFLPSIGLGYRLEVQPRMNLRLDMGFGRQSRGFYFNFNEAY